MRFLIRFLNQIKGVEGVRHFKIEVEPTLLKDNNKNNVSAIHNKVRFSLTESVIQLGLEPGLGVTLFSDRCY